MKHRAIDASAPDGLLSNFVDKTIKGHAVFISVRVGYSIL